jgi:hypothetical protein
VAAQQATAFNALADDALYMCADAPRSLIACDERPTAHPFGPCKPDVGSTMSGPAVHSVELASDAGNHDAAETLDQVWQKVKEQLDQTAVLSAQGEELWRTSQSYHDTKMSQAKRDLAVPSQPTSNAKVQKNGKVRRQKGRKPQKSAKPAQTEGGAGGGHSDHRATTDGSLEGKTKPMQLRGEVEVNAVQRERAMRDQVDEERHDEEGTSYAEGSNRPCSKDRPNDAPPKEPPPGIPCIPPSDVNRPLLEHFVFHVGDPKVAAPALVVKPRMSLRVPFTMKLPAGRQLAPMYVFEPTEELNKSTILLQKTAVRAEDLQSFHLTLINYTEQEVVLPSGIELAYASRTWDPSRDRSISTAITNQNKQTAQLFERISKENSATVLAGVQLRLNEVTMTKSEHGWKGLRYDRNNEKQVEELLKTLALDAMEFGDGEPVDKRRLRVRALLVEFIDVFAADNMCPGISDFEPLRIELNDPNARPIRGAPYRTTPLYRDFIAEQIEKLLKAGSIRPSYGPWASPVAVVRHPSGKLRMVCDYRRPNAVSKIDAHPLPDFEVILQTLGKMRYFSCVDLCSGYHQMPLDDQAQEMSAITTHLGVFEWLVTPFGLASAPAHFSRCVGAMLAGMTYRNAVSFIDDILIYSPTFDQHLVDLREFFTRLRSTHVSLKPSKCDFFANKASYLGFTPQHRHSLTNRPWLSNVSEPILVILTC